VRVRLFHTIQPARKEKVENAGSYGKEGAAARKLHHVGREKGEGETVSRNATLSWKKGASKWRSPLSSNTLPESHRKGDAA